MIKSKMIRDTVLLTLMQLALDSAALLLNVFINRHLGASAIGIFSLMGSFLGFAGILSNGNAFLCTSRLVSEELGKKCGDPNRVLIHGIKLCLLLSAVTSTVLLLFAQPLSSRFFSGADVAGAIRLMPVALVCGAVSSCLKGYFNACRKASAAACGDILEFAVKASVTFAAASATVSHSEGTVCRIMTSSIIAGNTASLIFMLVLFARFHMKSTGKCSIHFRQYTAAALPIMGGSILTSALSSTNDALIPICLRQFGDSHEQALSLFGIFEAIVIPTLFFPSVALCSMSGMIVSESARAAAARNSERIRSLTTRLIEYTMIYAVFASAVLIRFGRPLGHTLGGGELAGGLISAIAPVVPFIYMEIVLESMIKGMGQQSFSSLNYLAEYVIRIAAVLILVPRFGFVGIAVSYYASNIFGNISRFIKVIRTSGIQFRPFRMIISPVAYAFMTMALTELLFRLLSLSGDSAVKMVLFTIVWLAAYCGIILPMNILKPHRTDKSITIVESAQINMSKAL